MQDGLRSGLLNAVIARNQDEKAINALGHLVREIVERDHENEGFKEWLEPLEELIKWMGSEEEGAAETGTQAITQALISS